MENSKFANQLTLSDIIEDSEGNHSQITILLANNKLIHITLANGYDFCVGAGNTEVQTFSKEGAGEEVKPLIYFGTEYKLNEGTFFGRDGNKVSEWWQERLSYYFSDVM